MLRNREADLSSEVFLLCDHFCRGRTVTKFKLLKGSSKWSVVWFYFYMTRIWWTKTLLDGLVSTQGSQAALQTEVMDRHSPPVINIASFVMGSWGENIIWGSVLTRARTHTHAHSLHISNFFWISVYLYL